MSLPLPWRKRPGRTRCFAWMGQDPSPPGALDWSFIFSALAAEHIPITIAAGCCSWWGRLESSTGWHHPGLGMLQPLELWVSTS